MKKILVTGASTGIGYSIAKLLAENNFHVLAGVRTEQAFNKVQELGCEPLMLDVLNPTHLKELELKVASGGGLYGLVNNAGAAVAGPVEAVPLAELRYQMDVNFFSVFDLTQRLLPHLRAARGRVVNIGSIAGKIAPALMTPYSCSKFAIEALSDGLRREMKPHNVKVSLIEPGSVQTPIWKKSKEANEALLQSVPQELQNLYAEEIQKLRDSVAEAEARGVPALSVAKAVLHALTATRPKARYVVGPDAKITAMLVRILPDSLLDRIVKVV